MSVRPGGQRSAVGASDGKYGKALVPGGGSRPGQHTCIARASRIPAGGLFYHPLNLSNWRAPLFRDPGDWAASLRVLAEGQAVGCRRLSHENVPVLDEPRDLCPHRRGTTPRTLLFRRRGRLAS